MKQQNILLHKTLSQAGQCQTSPVYSQKAGKTSAQCIWNKASGGIKAVGIEEP